MTITLFSHHHLVDSIWFVWQMQIELCRPVQWQGRCDHVPAFRIPSWRQRWRIHETQSLSPEIDDRQQRPGRHIINKRVTQTNFEFILPLGRVKKQIWRKINKPAACKWRRTPPKPPAEHQQRCLARRRGGPRSTCPFLAHAHWPLPLSDQWPGRKSVIDIAPNIIEPAHV